MSLVWVCFCNGDFSFNVLSSKHALGGICKQYSSNLEPSVYHLFRWLIDSIKDRKFENNDELKRYLQDFLDSKTWGVLC